MKTWLSLTVVVIASPVLAAGFRIDTQSGRATGMGQAVSALIDDSSANFYNPAGLTAAGRGFEVMVGDSLIIPQVKFTAPNGDATGTVFEVSPPPHVYARMGLLDELALGVGVFTPFGAAGHWPEDWAGQYLAHQSSVQTFDININLAYRLHPRLSVAAGVNVVRGTVAIARHLDFIDSQGEVTLGGAAWGVNFNAALRVEMIENRLWFGGQVRTATDLAFVGNAHFEGVPVEFQSRIYDQGIKAHVTLPMTGQAGLGLKLMDRLRIGMDFTYVDWSKFRELRIEFENPDLTVPLPKNWYDTASFHVGAELDVSQSFAARIGFVYDPTPSPANTLTPELPDATRLKFCLGVGYKHSSGFFADLGFQFIALLAQNSSAPGFPGTYSGTAEVISLSLGYRHQAHPKAEVAPEAVPGEAPAPAGEQPMTSP
ncbi:MAG: outer membrane protein transport protein [Archangiaceae bacterium]|nr:outer membrane protein transport protein [Archangiaceae bacterium]